MISNFDLEKTYLSIINNPLMGIVIIVDYKAVFVNDRALEITGFSMDEFIELYNSGLDAIHPDDHKVLMEAKTEVNTENSIQMRILHKSKEYIWIESFKRTINYHGKQGGMLSFIDISKRIQYEKDLNEAAKDLISLTTEEEIYDYILSLLHKTHNDIIIVCNLKNINENKVIVRSITGVNSDFKGRAWKIMGFSPIGKEYPLKENHIDILNTGKLTTMEGSFSALAEGHISNVAMNTLKKVFKLKEVYLLGLKRNNVLFAEFQLYFRENSSKPQTQFIETLGSLASSVLHRKYLEKDLNESETKFGNLVEQSTDGILVVDSEGIMVSMNKSFEEIIGENKHNIIGTEFWHLRQKHLSNIEDHSYTEVSKSKFLEAVKTGKSQWFYKKNDRDFLRTDGSVRVLEMTAFPFTSHEGNNVCLIARDVSEQRKNEIKLQQQAQQLRELIHTKDRFFSIIAHDLKGPINNLTGFARLIKEEITIDNQVEAMKHAETIEKATIKISNLLGNLLEWSRFQTGKIPYNPTNFNIYRSILDNSEMFTELVKIKKIQLVIPEYKEYYVNADLNMINTVTRNLISNAIKFTNAGGTIKIKLEKKNKSVSIFILDNGVGMSQETLDKLFKIEHSFSSRGTENESGSGIGLILCKEFAEANGGTLSVKSKEKKWTEFIFTLPLSMN